MKTDRSPVIDVLFVTGLIAMVSGIYGRYGWETAAIIGGGLLVLFALFAASVVTRP